MFRVVAFNYTRGSLKGRGPNDNKFEFNWVTRVKRTSIHNFDGFSLGGEQKTNAIIKVTRCEIKSEQSFQR